MNLDNLDHDDQLRSLAMAVARNRVGPDDPIADILLREGVAPSDFEYYLTDKVFAGYVKAYSTELQENGFSFSAKCRVLAEDALKSMYQIAKDDEAPAAARVKSVENLVEWAGLGKKAQNDLQTGGGGPKYQLVINFSGRPETFNGVTIEQKEAQKTLESAVLDVESSPISREIDPDYDY